jgi:hypothetical protein
MLTRLDPASLLAIGVLIFALIMVMVFNSSSHCLNGALIGVALGNALIHASSRAGRWSTVLTARRSSVPVSSAGSDRRRATRPPRRNHVHLDYPAPVPIRIGWQPR